MTPSRQRRIFPALCLAVSLAACSSNPDSSGNSSSLIPDQVVKLSPSISTYPLEKLVYWGAYVGVAYLILDPFSPNWEIEEARLPENHVHFQMTMKRYYAGGAGEGRVMFHRRAKELMRAGGYAAYEVVEYSEGMESSIFGAQRTVEGVVRFSKAALG